jgi:catechol 2,3-dioxygenase-like lactoylglutathione lyase family enzyme
MGLATSTPCVDQAVGEGLNTGNGWAGRALTTRTLVIFILLFSPWNGSAFNGASSDRAEADVSSRKRLRFMADILSNHELFREHPMKASFAAMFSYLVLSAAPPLPIEGFSHIGFRVSDLEKTRAYYTGVLGYDLAFDEKDDQGRVTLAFFKINDDQFLEISPNLPAGEAVRLTHIAFVTRDLEGLRRAVTERGLNPTEIRKGRDGNLNFSVRDPLNTRIEFVQYMPGSLHSNDRGKHLSANRLSDHLQHTGVIVPRDKVDDAMQFYHDRLGFAEFWRYEPKPGDLRLIKLIAPGARKDIVELMITSGTPTPQQIGSMNHINFEVPDIHAAHRFLLARGAKLPAAFRPRVNAEDIWAINLNDPDGTRTEIQDLTKIPQATFYEEKVNGRDAYVLDNGWMRVSLLRGGGHIAEVRLKTGDRRKDLNPMRVPHYRTIDPHTYDASRDDAIYGDGPHKWLSAGYMGHLLCFPFYGPPSSEKEVRAGLGNHGEAPIVEWKKSNAEINTDGVAVRYYADLPKTQYRVERLVTLPRGLREVHVEEWVENLAGFDRPINWMEHATFGPPFLEPGKTIFISSTVRGDMNGNPVPPGEVSRRVMPGTPHSGGYTALLADPARKQQFFTVHDPDQPILIGYVFPSEGNPWIADWQENQRNQGLPWNGKVIARGIEFGSTPYAEGLRKSVERGSLLGAPAYRWIGARQKLKTEYTIFLRTIPDGFEGIREAHSEHGVVVVEGLP